MNEATKAGLPKVRWRGALCVLAGFCYHIHINTGGHMIGYATTEELIQYAAARGVTLSQAPEVLLTLALDYIESLEPLLDGERADQAQPYSWPRTLTAGVPLAIKQSQMIAAMTADTGVVLMPVTSGAQIIREKVGPLETEYAEGVSAGVSIPQIDGLIAPFLKNSGFFLNLVRV